MKKNKFSIFNFQLLLLLFAAACNAPDNNDKLSVEPSVVADSLFVPTGDAKLDSLLQVAAVAPQDTNLAKIYYLIGNIYEGIDYKKGEEYYLKLKDLSELLDWNKGRWMFSCGISNILFMEYLTDSALVVLSKGLELAKKENDLSWVANIYIHTGSTYMLKEWYETALDYYIEALSIAEEIKDDETIGILYGEMANLYRLIDIPEKAIEYGEKALVLRDNDPYSLVRLALAYSSAKQFEKASMYYKKALEISIRQNNNYLQQHIYYELGVIALYTFDLYGVEMYLNKMLEICRSVDNIINDEGYLYLLGRLEEMKGNFSKSEKHILQALERASKRERLETKRVCYVTLAGLSVAQRKHRDNIQYLLELDLVEQAISNETAIRAAAEKEAKYETEKKELEIESQRNIIARQTLQRNFFATGAAISVVFLALLWYMLRLRVRRNNALMERNDALSERNDALAEINMTKDKFFNIISHDLKNPAVAQRDALRLLVANARSWDADRLADFHAELLKVAEEQAELIYNLLGWGQLQTGRITYTPVTFSLSARLHSDIGLLRDMANYKGVSLIAQIPDNAIVTGDVNMLSTVVRNLLTNAIKFTGEGGVVTLAVSPNDDKEARPLASFTVSVTDTGIGMSEEQIQNLFRLDRKMSKQGTAGEQGTGLGLIVCKEFLEKHGSVLHIESVEGEGSRFWFEI